jgi:hypothetical protein
MCQQSMKPKMMTGLTQVERSSVVKCICYLFWLATIAFWSDPSWSQSSEQCDFFVPSSPKAAFYEGDNSLYNSILDYRQVDNAIRILRPLAEGGNSEAQYRLGRVYSYPKHDNVEAFKWFLRSAEQGYPAAMEKVTDAYRYGVGVEQNDEEADRWLEKTGPRPSFDIQSYLQQAAAGNDAAQVVIARGYERGNLLLSIRRKPLAGTRRRQRRGISRPLLA